MRWISLTILAVAFAGCCTAKTTPVYPSAAACPTASCQTGQFSPARPPILSPTPSPMGAPMIVAPSGQ
jgi:hypothetical protein